MDYILIASIAHVLMTAYVIKRQYRVIYQVKANATAIGRPNKDNRPPTVEQRVEAKDSPVDL